MRRPLLPLTLLLLAPALGCSWPDRTVRHADYQTVAADPRRDSERAGRLNAQAVALLGDGRLEQAEQLLKDALAADLFCGPAHNNLGMAYFHQGKYYLAAWEFQYAARLMPHAAEPRNNLGLVFETVGRYPQAAEWYEQALAIEPDNPQIIGNTARLMVRTGRRDQRTRQLLAELVLRDDRPEWVHWARQRLAGMGGPPPRPRPDPPPLP